MAGLRSTFISFLQRRLEARRVQFE
jgi:hypothetical protein